MSEPKKTPKRHAAKRKPRRRKNPVEESLMAAKDVAAALLTAYNIIAPLVKRMRKKK